MDLSGRDVSRILGLGQSTTALVLASGLAGPGHRRGRTVLYDREAVLALRDRPVVEEWTPLPNACRNGVLVARVGPRRNPAEPWPVLAAGPWQLNIARRGVLLAMRAHGPVPLVVTVGGYVLGGGEVTGHRYTGPTTHLETAPAGDWFTIFRNARVPLGAGEPLRFWRCWWCPQIKHRRGGATTLQPGPRNGGVRRARPRAAAG